MYMVHVMIILCILFLISIIHFRKHQNLAEKSGKFVVEFSRSNGCSCIQITRHRRREIQTKIYSTNNNMTYNSMYFTLDC